MSFTVAIMGRPNVGKSTLFNRLAGKRLALVDPRPGMTRDRREADIEFGDIKAKLVDTAGLEEGDDASIEGRMRRQTNAAIIDADIILFLIDARAGLTPADEVFAELARQTNKPVHLIVNKCEGRALIIAVNKIDLKKDNSKFLSGIRERVERLLPQIKGVPVIPVSALHNRGIEKMMQAVFEMEETWNKRIGTSALNHFLRDAVDRHTPPAVSGRRLRLRYMTQANARPPTFICFCSRPEVLPTSYVRYLVNGIREAFDIWGVPVRLHMRKGKNPYDSKED